MTLFQRRLIDWTLGTFTMLIALLLLSVPLLAGATGYTPPKQDREQSIKVGQSQGQYLNPDMSMYNNPLNSQSSGHTYVFPAPAMAAPLPTGMCPKGDSESWSVIWGFVSYATSSMRTEMACLDKLIAYGRDTQPKPPPPVILTAPAVECVAAKKPAKKVAAKSCK